jgi:hypothetical protein
MMSTIVVLAAPEARTIYGSYDAGRPDYPDRLDPI